MGIAASVLFSLVALLSYRYPILPGINGVGRHSLGTFFYATSIGLLTAAFWPMNLPQYAALGILVMTWGDGLAALGADLLDHGLRRNRRREQAQEGCDGSAHGRASELVAPLPCLTDDLGVIGPVVRVLPGHRRGQGVSVAGDDAPPKAVGPPASRRPSSPEA